MSDCINTVMYDTQAKECVLITNAICTLDHSTSAAFEASHHDSDGVQQHCHMVPHEAIALRVFIESDHVQIAWTYRSVDSTKLRPLTDREAEAKAQFTAAMTT